VSLEGLKVLITRPAGQAGPLLDAIAAAGGEAWHQPVLAIEGLSESDSDNYQRCKQYVMDLDLYQQVIFISTNAVSFGLEWVETYWPQLPVGVQWHAIGSATADAMRAAGLPVTVEGGLAMNSEELLACPELQNVESDKILIVRGLGGREHLATQLQERGAHVDYVECYQRVKPELAPGQLAALIRDRQINTVCLNSGESLNNLCALLGADVALAKACWAVVPGERVAALAKEAGFERVAVASNAGLPATIAALQSIGANR